MKVKKLCLECGTEFFTNQPHRLHCSGSCLFWSHVDRSAGPLACWPWTAYINPTSGYGCVPNTISGRRDSAHRHAYRLAKGEPGPWCVLHRCDFRPCSNPAHLFLGTKADNLADAVAKGRPVITAPGVLNRNAKLTPEIVRYIRQSDHPEKRIAEELGICTRTVWSVRSRQTWRHVA